ncbi:hypothetical protein [Allomesorhizobium camelthorni]|uniref:Uncharacterized protein n=1 Tax=Allomesorhizobium camelthorni TaxID=475069 RepID=A0A6G4W8K5_9HYPH|nr:hypothetical protein [Mesorhizobium camelthorni]
MNPFVAMVVPILLMFGYLGLSLFAGRIRLHGEQTGDNLYYMGFLFTLSSMGVSLYQFTSAASTDDVIRNFGIAITSTIVGIALRILYNQTRRDVLDIERATRFELADMTRRVRSELEHATREFADFRRVSNQMISEGFDEIVKQADTTGVQLKDALEKMANEAIKPVEAASSKLSSAIDASFGQIASKLSEIAEKVDSSGDVFEKANSGMANSTTQLGTQVEAISKKLEAVMVPEAVLKNELGPLVKELGKIVVDYGAKTEAVSREQAQRMDLITAAVAKIVETTGRSVQMMERSVEASAAVQRSTDGLAQHVQQQNADIQKLLEKLVAEFRPAPKPAVFESFAPAPGVSGGLNGGSYHPAAGAVPTAPLEEVIAATTAAEVVEPARTAPESGTGVNVDINFDELESSTGDTDAKRWWQRR